MRKSMAAAVAAWAALVGLADTAGASATIDLIWAETGARWISSARVSSEITLRVILTAGPKGSSGASVNVAYGPGELVEVDVLDFASTAGGPLPVMLGTTIDTGTRIENINSFALEPLPGTGLAAGASHQLGTIRFHVTNSYWSSALDLIPDTAGLGGILDLAGNDVSATSTLRTATVFGPNPDYCAIVKKCSVGGGEPQDACSANRGDEVTYHYDFIGGSALIYDDKLGLIGEYEGRTLTRTTVLTQTTTNTAYFEPLAAVCLAGDFFDSVTVTVRAPTPTPTATPTPPPSACVEQWPVVQVTTIGKGQSASVNPRLAHVIVGHIIDPASVGQTAHRIEVCAGTEVNARIIDTTAPQVSQIVASDGLDCSSLSACSGIIAETEKYKAISGDGRDRDSIVFVPK